MSSSKESAARETLSTSHYPPVTAHAEQRDSLLPSYEANKSDEADEDGKESVANHSLPLDEEAATNSTSRSSQPLRRMSRRERCGELFCNFRTFTILYWTVLPSVVLLYLIVPFIQEKGSEDLRLTGERSDTPGHKNLFRICASSFATTGTFAAHTCNVYRPLHDVNSPPMHAFTEEIRHWETWSAAAKEGPDYAAIIQAVSLQTLLLDQGLQCASTGFTPPAGISQLVIGGVGSYAKDVARACYFDEKGDSMQEYCSKYANGGRSAWGTPHPLSINDIFHTHFGMNCTWIGR